MLWDTEVDDVTLKEVLWDTSGVTLCDTAVLPVKLELELRDKVVVTLGLEDSVADILVL